MHVPSATTSDAPAVSVRDLVISFGDGPVIDGVSVEVKRGSVTALIGPNGSGKTTLLRAVLDLIPKDSGTVEIFGKPIDDVRELIGYVPQKLNFDLRFPITVGEYLELSRHPHCPQSRIEEKAKEVGLRPGLLNSRLGSLSGGQLQRALIAQAILNEPHLLILDEPSTGIDIVGERNFYDLIRHLNREHDTTVLIVSHELAVVSEIVDFVICLNRRLMCYGPPKKALTEKKISELFGYDANYYGHEPHDHGPDHLH